MKKCITCQTEFSKRKKDSKTEWSKRKFCSHKCYSEYLKDHPTRKRVGIYKKCESCGKDFYVINARKDIAKFCSMKCMGIAKRGNIPKTAWKKGDHASPTTEFKKGMISPMKGRKFSKEHIAKVRESRMRNGNATGKNHYNWQGGKSFILYPQEFNQKLKDEIRERDGFKCCLCNKTEIQELEEHRHKLAIDHVNGDKKNNLHENLRTLCKRCNSSEMQRRRKTTRECEVTE